METQTIGNSQPMIMDKEVRAIMSLTFPHFQTWASECGINDFDQIK